MILILEGKNFGMQWSGLIRFISWFWHCLGGESVNSWKKNSDFYVFSLFEGNTLSTKNYDLSMESVNKNTSFESNIFQKYLCKEILEIACFVFVYIHSSNNVCYGKNVGTNTSWEKEKHLSKSSVHFTVSIYPVCLPCIF